ncbi:MAG TPA: rod shape-determining protein, partial [Firmicutes bacterium]|nr:rod shape-determining protein [Bacillota bacterium]
VMEKTPPELTGDIRDSGIVLTGGAAQLNGLAELLTRRTGVVCRVAENPADCVAVGTGKALKYVGVLSSGVYDISRFTTSALDPTGI